LWTVRVVKILASMLHMWRMGLGFNPCTCAYPKSFGLGFYLNPISIMHLMHSLCSPCFNNLKKASQQIKSLTWLITSPRRRTYNKRRKKKLASNRLMTHCHLMTVTSYYLLQLIPLKNYNCILVFFFFFINTLIP
jgi:hypothetical protein